MTSSLPRTVYGLVPWSSRVALPNDSFVIQLGNNLTWLHLELVSCKTSGLNSFARSLQWATSKCNEGCGHNCQQICKFVSLVMRIMDFILMSLFIRMPGGLGPFGGNKLRTLPMHFKTHQCHIKGEKNMFPLLSVHCSFHLGEPDAISYGSFYCCKLIPCRCWDFSWIHRLFQMGTCLFHPLSKTGNYRDAAGSRYQCGNTKVSPCPYPPDWNLFQDTTLSKLPQPENQSAPPSKSS